MKLIGWRFNLMTVALMMPLIASAAQLYRYTDEQGRVVLDRQGVPPAAVSRGYEVLTPQGRVLRSVPPALTADERAEQEAMKQQAKSDAQLLYLYSSVADIDQARDRRLVELDGVMSITRGNLSNLHAQRQVILGQAAAHERAGREVPQELLQQMKNLEREERGMNARLAEHAKLRDREAASFATDRARLEHLLSN